MLNLVGTSEQYTSIQMKHRIFTEEVPMMYIHLWGYGVMGWSLQYSVKMARL